jgi:hypothetical protein
VELEGKSVKMANVQGAKVMVEVVVEQSVVYGEVIRLLVRRLGDCLGPVASPVGPLGGRLDRPIWVRKESILIWGVDI